MVPPSNLPCLLSQRKRAHNWSVAMTRRHSMACLAIRRSRRSTNRSISYGVCARGSCSSTWGSAGRHRRQTSVKRAPPLPPSSIDKSRALNNSNLNSKKSSHASKRLRPPSRRSSLERAFPRTPSCPLKAGPRSAICL